MNQLFKFLLRSDDFLQHMHVSEKSLVTASSFRLGSSAPALAAANLARRSPAAFSADWTIS